MVDGAFGDRTVEGSADVDHRLHHNGMAELFGGPRVTIEDALPLGVTAKDVILAIIGKIGAHPTFDPGECGIDTKPRRNYVRAALRREGSELLPGGGPGPSVREFRALALLLSLPRSRMECLTA